MLLLENLLTDVEVRVLGALLEKETTTPEYYPLSLNALVNACNQKSNREPAMELDQSAVRDALNSLGERGLAGPARCDGRVEKFEHYLQDAFNSGRRETAVLCVLLLRGPQTAGELRGRTERMFRFEELSDVQSTLQRMSELDPPLVKVLPRAPGTKEARYVQLFGIDEPVADAPTQGVNARGSIAALETEVRKMAAELAEIRDEFARFRRQFE